MKRHALSTIPSLNIRGLLNFLNTCRFWLLFNYPPNICCYYLEISVIKGERPVQNPCTTNRHTLSE